jgi:hypothetical protein
MDWNSLFNAMLNGFFVGLGSATATYIVTKHFVHNLEKLETKIKGNGKNA